MVLKCYFDGGNQADNPEHSHSCLATVSGSDHQWRRFNTEWEKALYRHKANFLHTTDAISLQNEFCAENGWSHTRVNEFIRDCVDVIEKHIEIPLGTPNRRPRKGLYPTTFLIPLADWLRARGDLPSLPNTVAEICATESLGFCFKRGHQLGATSYELFFDRGEPFYGHVSDRCRSPKARRDMPLLNHIVGLGEYNSRNLPALQVADLFAWCINHNHQVVWDWHEKLHSLPWASRFMGYDLLMQPSRRAIEMTRSWKLPQRVATEKRVARISPDGVIPTIPENLIPNKNG